MPFDLGELLQGVSDLGTKREQIEYIRLDLIDEDPNNFYQLSGIEELAANIQLCGLQQPIRVRPIADTDRYMIVSGHRRRKAVELLAKDEPEKWGEVPCIVEDDAVSPSLQQLRLIYANANTRTMTSAEISEQAVQVEKLLYQLKEEGYEFPGRMRDHVAQAVGASKSKLARLKVIRDNLAKCWEKSFKKDDIKESAAYALAQLPKEWQQMIYDAKKEKSNRPYVWEDDVKRHRDNLNAIDKLKCSIDGAPCVNRERKKLKAVRSDCLWNVPCTKCCKDCSKLTSCKSACPNLADEIKRQRAAAREDSRQAKIEKENAERPFIEQLQSLWLRFGCCREQACASVEQVYRAMGRYYTKNDDKRVADFEGCISKFTKDTETPFGYICRLDDIKKLIKLADFLNVSLDYLFCRTDVKEMAQAGAVSESGTGWQTGKPEAYGTYAAYVKVTGAANPMLRELLWDGAEWFLFGQKIGEDVMVQCWADRPEF